MPGTVAPSLLSDCDKPSVSGFNFMKEIELSKKGIKFKGIKAQVDDEDYDRINIFNWTVSKSKHGNTMYAYKNIFAGHKNIGNIKMHRYIMGLMAGDNREVDHIDGNGLNNQKSNLRICSHIQNSANRGSHRNSISKYAGVGFSKERNKWTAQITHNYKMYALGRFLTEKEAAIAYNKKAVELFGEFAKLNKVD